MIFGNKDGPKAFARDARRALIVKRARMLIVKWLRATRAARKPSNGCAWANRGGGGCQEPKKKSRSGPSGKRKPNHKQKQSNFVKTKWSAHLDKTKAGYYVCYIHNKGLSIRVVDKGESLF